ncbi:MAG: PAS domain S-box protein [Desulfitobacteriaceae bacterium]
MTEINVTNRELLNEIEMLKQQIIELKTGTTLRKFEFLIDSSEDAIFENTFDGTILYWNKGAEQIYGYQAKEIVGKSIYITVPPFYHRNLAETYKKIRNGESVDYYETVRVRKDGVLINVSVKVSPIRDAQGNLIGASAIVRDITSQKKIEEAIRLSEEKNRAIINNVGEAIIMVGKNFQIETFNPAAERIFKYYASEVIGKNINILFPASSIFGVDNFIYTNFLSRQDTMSGESQEVVARRKDGSLFPVIISFTDMNLGHTKKIVGIIRDVTELKRAAEVMEDAKEAAEAANKAKSEFLASMSHEIRTPMNAILGMAELLSETSLNDEQKKYVEVFRSAGDNLLSIINDILDISKVETGQVELEKVSFNLQQLVERTGEVLAIRAHQKDIELIIRFMPGVPLNLIGDPQRLRQILVNLIGNSIKFTSQGEIVVTIAQQCQDQGENGQTGGCQLTFSVADTGVGIPSDKLDVIFDRFTQVDSSRTGVYGGTGLGLTISKRLVSLMGGNIWVESEFGKGSVFTFCIQLPIDLSHDPGIKCEQVVLQGIKVLVIDDNFTNCLILRETLADWGTLVTTKENGPAGLEELQRAKKMNDPYKLVLLDCRMPVMDGFTVADKIQNNPGLAGTTIMMLTSDMRIGDINRYSKSGISSYLTKPIKRADLRYAIEGALSKKIQPQSSDNNGNIPHYDGDLNILLVDDSADNRMLIEAYLKTTSYRVDIAENGEIGVKKFMTGTYDIVLMDIRMPIMDGYAATRAIREWESFQCVGHTPVVALTANAVAEDVQQSLEAGCDAHLAKPIGKLKLLETITKFTKGSTPIVEKTLERIVVTVDKDLVDIIPEFMENRTKDIVLITEALEQRDYETICRLGHTLKGIGGGFGFPFISELGVRLEQVAKEADNCAITQLVTDLKEYLGRVHVVA